jgi:hypothetical protein
MSAPQERAGSAVESPLDITAPGAPAEPPSGLTERELAEWLRDQLAQRDAAVARLKSLLLEREAAAQGLQREAERTPAERARAEAAEAQIVSLRGEVARLREEVGRSLAKADRDLQAAAQRVADVNESARRSMPPPPIELEEERVRNAHLVSRLAEV